MTRTTDAAEAAQYLEASGQHLLAASVWRLLEENCTLRAQKAQAAVPVPALGVSKGERRRQKAEALLRQRVAHVQRVRRDWRSGLSYNDIRTVLGMTGAEVIKPVYAALYYRDSAEFALVRSA